MVPATLPPSVPGVARPNTATQAPTVGRPPDPLTRSGIPGEAVLHNPYRHGR